MPRGHLLLEGGAEFGGRMSEPDRRAIELAGGPDVPIRILPTAAAPDNNHARAGSNGVRWFRSLRATDVVSVPLIDRASALDAGIAASLRQAKMIYLLGGFPRFLGETLKATMAWQAILQAYVDGAIIGGSSAGAMVLCGFYHDPDSGDLCEGLSLVPNACVLPHHNNFGAAWAARLVQRLPGGTLIGIDERTGMIDDGLDGTWTVYGQGAVTLYRGGGKESYPSGKTFSL